MAQSRHFETNLIHAGANPDNEYGALATPLYQTSTFIFETAEQGGRRFAGEEGGYIYTRLGNPTTRQLEERMASLEGMEDAAATATGMGAVASALMANLSMGDHLISSNAVYGCTYALLTEQFARFGIEVTMVDMSDHQQVTAALRENTKAIFLETPVNPNMAVFDLAWIGQFAQKNNLLSFVDNTFLTPYLQKPKDFGIDVVIHSATKYLNGHGDVIAGIICASKEQIELIKFTTLKDMGATISPHDAWLILRGLKTLAVRMDRHCENAMKIATFLEEHPSVSKVHYPGLKSHAAHRFIGKQMSKAGGVIAFELNADYKQSISFLNQLSIFKIAVSLGDAESLIQHPASMTHSPYTPEARALAGISDNLIRISVGLEHSQDLIDDLANSLSLINNS
ncbi:MAG: methionine gamma-lyase [Psychrobium sp.]|nr:methionine gamma-lyase [Psychrobium sp.]